MFLKVSRSLLFVLFTVSVFAVLSLSVFAEGDVVCSGKVMGISDLSNPNAGQTHFDSHPSPNPDANKVVDRSIVGLVDGLALEDNVVEGISGREYAACAEETTVDVELIEDREYVMRGWAWNDNLGFISFYCNGGWNEGLVAPETCGVHDYEVVISAEDVAGVRQFSGHAWNDAFGYIDFDPTYADPAAGVTMDAAGNLSGFAWSEAEVWIDFNGVRIQLPDEVLPLPADDYCDGKPFVCVEVTPDPWIEFGEDVNLADGIDSYQVDVYLREDDGVTELDLDVYNVDLEFSWKDTVKINQLTHEEIDERASEREESWDDGFGGIVYKPININNSVDFLGDFYEIDPAGDPGHYELNRPITSYAPTTNSNVSYTTSLKPTVSFSNEIFVDELVELVGEVYEVWTDKIEPNELILESIKFEIYDIATSALVEEGVVYPNGKDGQSLKFRPILELETLYANDEQDRIDGFRNIPVNFTLQSKKNGEANLHNDKIKLILDFAKIATEAECGVDGGNFIFSFLDFPDGNRLEEWPDTGKLKSGWYSHSALVGGVDIQAIPELPVEEAVCGMAQGPTLYSEISYTIDGKTVSYYGNKLPRLVTVLGNPAAVVHGNIYAPKAFSPTAAHKTQATGNIAIDIVRNTVNENIKRYLKVSDASESFGCRIRELKDLDSGGVEGVCYYDEFAVGDEYVLYFKDSDVTLDLKEGGASGYWENKWVLVVDGGNLYIDEDVYSGSLDSQVSIVVLRPYGSDCDDMGNVYIDSNVKNIQANIVADCSVFSYNKDLGVEADGFPDWGDDPFTNMVTHLNKQLLIEGSIASRNTIGGADLDSASNGEAPLEYLLLGTGEVLELPVTQEERLEAQMYDLNYLRLFKLDVETSESGLPIDQKCGKALSIADMVQIQKYMAGEEGVEAVYGEGIDPPLCDGIDPLTVWDPDEGKLGDLVPPKGDSSILSQGLDDEVDFDPVYIYYVAPDSFVFRKGEMLGT